MYSDNFDQGILKAVLTLLRTSQGHDVALLRLKMEIQLLSYSRFADARSGSFAKVARFDS